MSEYKPLEELFKEYFPAWVKDIQTIEQVSASVILVTLSNKDKYTFGKKDGAVFLAKVKEESQE